jgi:hypothetical protein
VAARDLRVVAHDGIDVAASVATEDGQPVLIVLRKGQTFESAVDALAKALPNEHPSTVNALVRQALPDAPLLRAELQEHSPVIVRPVPLVSPGRRFTVAAAVVTAVFTLVTYSYAARGAVSATRQPGPAPTVAAGAAAPDGVYEDVVRAAQLAAFETFVVAYRSDGPTSSTSSSTTVRFSPSFVSYVRLRSRPLTMTRVPRVRDSATFSAASRQTEQRMKRVSPSFHSFDCGRTCGGWTRR